MIKRVKPQIFALILTITGIGIYALLTNHIEVVTVAVGGLIAFGKDIIKGDVADD